MRLSVFPRLCFFQFYHSLSSAIQSAAAPPVIFGADISEARIFDAQALTRADSRTAAGRSRPPATLLAVPPVFSSVSLSFSLSLALALSHRPSLLCSAIFRSCKSLDVNMHEKMTLEDCMLRSSPFGSRIAISSQLSMWQLNGPPIHGGNYLTSDSRVGRPLRPVHHKSPPRGPLIGGAHLFSD